MPLLDYDAHLSVIRSQVGDNGFCHPSSIPYQPINVKIGDSTKGNGNSAGAYFNFKPWMYSVYPMLAASREEYFSRQGVIFISNLRVPWAFGGAFGRNAAVTFDYRCILCSGNIVWYTPPPPYDNDLLCHDVMKLLRGQPELRDIAAFRKADGSVVMAEDWSRESLGGEKEVEALYRFMEPAAEEIFKERQARETPPKKDLTRKRIEYLLE